MKACKSCGKVVDRLIGDLCERCDVLKDAEKSWEAIISFISRNVKHVEKIWAVRSLVISKDASRVLNVKVGGLVSSTATDDEVSCYKCSCGLTFDEDEDIGFILIEHALHLHNAESSR